MKISVLTPDLSHNCLGRAYLLAKILQRRYEVEIIGPVFGSGIWEPLAQAEELKYKYVKDGDFPYFLMQIKGMLGEITGDVIYASKPLFTSFGIGLLKEIADNMSVIKGMVRIALCDQREGLATYGLVNDFFVGEDNPVLIHIPEKVLHGFRAYGTEPAFIINKVTQPYNHQEPDEFRIDPFENDISYDWALKQG